MQWDILTGPVPEIPRKAIVLHLAGVVRGDSAALAANTSLALRVCNAARSAGAKHLFIASSAAVYGRGGCDHAETDVPYPVSDYGRAKMMMEDAVIQWQRGAGPDAPGVTCLRIGNVVGADALFGQRVAGPLTRLDQGAGFGAGPIRSYIGPRALGFVLAQLLCRADRGSALPDILNVAAPQPVAMAELLAAAERDFSFEPAGENVIEKVSLSTARLAALVTERTQSPAEMIADWQSLVAVAR